MPFTAVDVSWAMFGRRQEFALVGKHAIATVSGIYGRFVDLDSGRTRIERFEGPERGDGACCVAGLAVAPIFSLVERRANPRISVFSYPAMRRISRCANSQEAHGYLCCAFAGTEYLLGQTTYPDFRLILWRWRTGERLTSISATSTLDVDRTILACSIDSGRFVARGSKDGGDALSVYRVLACSDLVRLFPIEIDSRGAVSFSWSYDETLLCCDQRGNLWSVQFDEDGAARVETLVERNDADGTRRNFMLVAHGGGALIVDRPVEQQTGPARATFYRKASQDPKENWRAAWTASLPCYPDRAVSDPREERILILGESGGDLYEITAGSGDRAVRAKLLLRNRADYTTIAPLSGHRFAAFDRNDRLFVLDGSTGSLVSSTKQLRLSHHGKVVRVARHPSLPILATCSSTGNCLLVDGTAPASVKIASCVHLQREPLNRLKFSRAGGLLGVGASRLGRLFLLSVSSPESGPSISRVASWLNVGRKLLDFLIYETDRDLEPRILILVGGSSDRRAGNEILVYTRRLFAEFPEKPSHAIILPSSFDTLHHGISPTSGDIFGAPYLSKQLHRIEPRHDSGDAVILDALPSLHQMGKVEINVHGDESASRRRLISYGCDGLIVLRDCAEPRRVFAVFPGHHRADGGVRRAILVGGAIVSLGENGDLVASKLSGSSDRVGGKVGGEGSKLTGVVDRTSRNREEAKSTGENGAEDWEADCWTEARIRDRSIVEQKLALPSRLSVLEDLNELKRRVNELIDSNEKQPPHARLPISAFDLDRQARERKLAEARAERESLVEQAEELVARQDRASCYLRERFLEPLIVPPRSLSSSAFPRRNIANYPLLKIDSERANLRAWSRFSRQLASRLDEGNGGNPFEPRLDRGFVEIVEASADSEERERELKVRFNDRFETLRKAKREVAKTRRKLAEETRRCVDELNRVFREDAGSKLIEAPGTDEEEFDSWSDSSDESANNAGNEREVIVAEEESPSEVDDFRRHALDRMMDGVLEFGLADLATRNVPIAEGLAEKDPSDYTEEDVRAIESYESKLAARRAAREKYKSMLERKIERAHEESRIARNAFDEQLNELSLEKLRVERTLLSEKLSRILAIVGHRRIVRARREIRRANQTDLAEARIEARRLVEERELFEASVVELRNRYESARKREKCLEEKFRAELSEQLMRECRRRPRIRIAAASVTLLDELASCLIDERAASDLLPPEWLDYLRAVNRLDARPDTARSEPERWRAVCRFRRTKLEAETKVRSCAIELAEAEHSLSFVRKACSAGRAAIERREREIRGLEDALLDLRDDREVRLVVKTGQLQRQPEGCPRTDREQAILGPRQALVRANEALDEAGRRKLLAARRLADRARVLSVAEWRHARAKTSMERLQELAKDLEAVRVSRAARQSRDRDFNETTPKQPVRIVGDTFAERLKEEARTWRRRNATLAGRIARSRAERDELIAACNEPLRSRNAAFRRRKMRAIERKARLARRIRRNFDQLSTLEARLEASKLRTYPTLGMKF